MPRRCKRIEKFFETVIGNPEIESILSNENENDNIETETVYLNEDEELNKFKDNSDYLLEKIYNIFLYLQNIFKIIFGLSGIYLVWICLHYFASHLYIKLCVPSTIIGFLMSPFMTASPHCQGLRWIVYNAANAINNMWIVLGAWICTNILNFNIRTQTDIPS